MFDLSFPQVLLLIVIVWLVFASRSLWPHLRHLEHELLQRMPVFSAETTRHTEAEFIRDRLPRRIPWMLFALAALGAAGTVVLWWLGLK
jgi:hypothetical protein